jgi:DNA modification methylase
MPIPRDLLELLPHFWQSPCASATLYRGHVIDVLKKLQSGSVHMVCTSPPYWNLRDYQTGSWEGGDPLCDHRGPPMASISTGLRDLSRTINEGDTLRSAFMPWKNGVCGKCGARRIDQQIGSEDTPEEFVQSMVGVFREVRRVLRSDGTCFLNLGDTWLDDGNQGLIPTRVAIALIEDGWTCRQDIIWHSTNKMPESVTNRCSKSHEHIFLLTKGSEYYFDSEAIKVEAKSEYKSSDFIPKSQKDQKDSTKRTAATGASKNGRSNAVVSDMANKRDVWIVPIKGYKGAHFAAFNPQLITPCILAGTSEYGCCSLCGVPWHRVVKKERYATRPGNDTKVVDEDGERLDNKQIGNRDPERHCTRTTTVGWSPGCPCKAEVVPCTVLDPFVGSGTSVSTSISLGRRGIGIDLNEKYLAELAIPRIEEAIASVASQTKKKLEIAPQYVEAVPWE